METTIEFNEAAFRHGINKEETDMARMTEQEAWELEDFVTNNEIELGPNGADFLSRREMRVLGMNDLAYNYLLTRAESANQSIGHIINELVQEKIESAG